MFSKSFLTFATGAGLLVGVSSCTENAPPAAPRPAPPPLQTEPIGLQMTRAEPRLADTPFRVLLDFERPTDLAFLVPQAGAVQSSTEQAHTGLAALKLERGGTFEVKLGSLIAGTAFPGGWTLAGAYFSSAAGTAQSTVTVTIS